MCCVYMNQYTNLSQSAEIMLIHTDSLCVTNVLTNSWQDMAQFVFYRFQSAPCLDGALYGVVSKMSSMENYKPFLWLFIKGRFPIVVYIMVLLTSKLDAEWKINERV